MTGRLANNSDVLIVGGGPAGLTAALALRQRGASVTVVDSMRPPIDKACGEGLMPDSLAELAHLGVQLTQEDGAEFRGIRFVNHRGDHHIAHANLDVATANFPAGTEGCGMGLGLRRLTLHSRLVEQAGRAGVTLRWESPVQLNATYKEQGKVLVGGEPFQFGWLIGADGQSSRVRRWAGLESGLTVSRRFGFRQHFRVPPWSPYVEVHWGMRGQAYITPVGPNEICVAAMVRDPHHRLSTVLDGLPALRERLGNPTEMRSVAMDNERGAMTTTRRLSRVAIGRVALIGDASGSADAITGEGMGMAFRQALLLAECLAASDLERYDRLHSAILKLPQTMACVMLTMDRSEAFRNRALHLLASESALFSRMLGVHLGKEPLLKFVGEKGLEVAWRLIAQSKSQAIQSEWRSTS